MQGERCEKMLEIPRKTENYTHFYLESSVNHNWVFKKSLHFQSVCAILVTNSYK